MKKTLIGAMLTMKSHHGANIDHTNQGNANCEEYLKLKTSLND